MKKKIIVLLIVLTTCLLFADYDEKKILLNNASNMIKVRKYTLADELLSEALEKYPDDTQVIMAILDLYVLTNESDKAIEILKDKSELLPQFKRYEYQITFSLIQKSYQIALDKAQSYLSKNNSSNDFSLMGALFQRYRAYTESITIYLQGEKLYPTIFSVNLADSYYFERNYDEAIRYYLIALENNIGHQNLSNSRIRNIIKDSPKSVATLVEHFGSDSSKIQITNINKSIIDVYIEALLNTDRIELALALLEKYEPKDIYTKAEQFRRLKSYEISALLYEMLLAKEENPTFIYRYTFNYASMLIENGKYTHADSLVNTIIFDESNKPAKRNIMFDSYLLKADLVYRNRKLSEGYLSYLNEADKFAFNNNQKQTLQEKISYYKILRNDLQGAVTHLANLRKYGANDAFFFNAYLLEVMQSGAEADSLATELLITAPNSDYTSEMLELKYFLKSLNPTDKNLFLDAYRNEKLFLITEADSLYQKLFISSKKEIFKLRNAMMNKKNLNELRAKQLFSDNYKDEFCRDFASLQLVLTENKNSNIAKDMARNFLTQYPGSTFAAEVRQILMINQNN